MVTPSLDWLSKCRPFKDRFKNLKISSTCPIAINASGQPPVVDMTMLTNYTPSLVTNTTYYWVITATDGISTVVGPMWRFTTVGLEYVYLPLVLRNF